MMSSSIFGDSPSKRRILLGAIFGLAAAPISCLAQIVRSADNKRVEQKPLVGLAYTMWHFDANWAHPRAGYMRPWGTPALGYYSSSDPAIWAKHAEMLVDAGVDFIYLDWSNDIEVDPQHPTGSTDLHYTDPLYVENVSMIFIKSWSGLERTPKIAIMIGPAGEMEAFSNGKMKRKADQVFNTIVTSPSLGGRYQRLHGKPLLIVFLGAPSPFQHGLPPWDDKRFTVRYMGGFLTEQPALLSANRESKFGYWSWEDRGAPTFSSHDGKVEAVTVVAAWRPEGSGTSPGRRNGVTFVEGWERARTLKPQVVLAGTFNEWWIAEQPSAEISKDVEPSLEFGSMYLDLIREQGALLRRGE